MLYLACVRASAAIPESPGGGQSIFLNSGSAGEIAESWLDVEKAS
jgi:hypothetical protein